MPATVMDETFRWAKEEARRQTHVQV